jgi:hypothetical protein
MEFLSMDRNMEEQLRRERQQARAGAKLFAKACRSGDVGQFYAAVEAIRYLDDGWTFAFRRVAQLPSRVPEIIQHEFQLLWFESKFWGSRCDDKRALLDALRVLFPPYQGPTVRVWRGAAAREQRLRKFYGPSWSASIEEADFFARHFQTCPGGSVVFESLAPAEAIISAPCLTGPYFEEVDGQRRYDEHEYLVDGRRLHTVHVVRRYQQIGLEEWKRQREAESARS